MAQYTQQASSELGNISANESRQALEQQAKKYLLKMADMQAENINYNFDNIAAKVDSMAQYMEKIYANADAFAGHSMPLPNQVQAGTASEKYMLAPDVVETPILDREIKLISNATYMFSAIYANNNIIDNCYIGTKSGICYDYSKDNDLTADYDPRKREWYKKAMARKGNIVWIGTYTDSAGKLEITCAKAFKDANGNFIGVVATDIILKQVIDKIIGLRIGSNGYAFLLDDKGAYIAHPDYMQAGFNVNARENASDTYKKALTNMINGKSGTQKISIKDKEYYLAYNVLPATGWSLGLIIPIKDVVAASEASKTKIDGYSTATQKYINQSINDIVWRFFVLFILCLVFFVVISCQLAGKITKPIKILTAGVKKISAGEFNYKIAVTSKDEIGELADNFNKMGTDIQSYMRNLANSIAEKEKINSELNVAADIQNDMLPKIFPKYEHINGLNLYAKMQPAKIVGGDFYDFFYMDDNQTKLCVVIADVSGKGIPASLFMVIAKHIIKTSVLNSENLSDGISNANNLLCEDNNTSMFVTAFIAVLDLSDGCLEYVSCGHNPPLFASNTEEFRFIKVKKALPLAVAEKIIYQCDKLYMESDDTLVLYTDGVNEAANENNELFGDNRFINILNRCHNNNIENIDDFLRQEISKFAGKAEQADDITTLFIRIVPKD